jgi:YidC/Oxa1 family membrane protein insertase
VNPLAPIENVLTHVLEWLHGTVGLPWAWAVVALTLIVRMLLVPLTVRQIHSMQRMQAHLPEMKAIQAKYKGDRARMNQELMGFYKENKINPASSCLPIVAQIPIFFALYFVLKDFEKEIFPNYPGSDLGWLGIVPDITAPANSHWSGYLLLAIYAISQTASTLLMSSTMDRTQRTLLLILPLAFLFVVLNFPAGLVLY